MSSSYIRAALKYQPNELIVVDINENGLTELTRTLRSDANVLVPNIYITYPMSGQILMSFIKCFKNMAHLIFL